MGKRWCQRCREWGKVLSVVQRVVSHELTSMPPFLLFIKLEPESHL